jgi:hypothetical protein
MIPKPTLPRLQERKAWPCLCTIRSGCQIITENATLGCANEKPRGCIGNVCTGISWKWPLVYCRSLGAERDWLRGEVARLQHRLSRYEPIQCSEERSSPEALLLEGVMLPLGPSCGADAWSPVSPSSCLAECLFAQTSFPLA